MCSSDLPCKSNMQTHLAVFVDPERMLWQREKIIPPRALSCSHCFSSVLSPLLYSFGYNLKPLPCSLFFSSLSFLPLYLSLFLSHSPSPIPVTTPCSSGRPIPMRLCCSIIGHTPTVPCFYSPAAQTATTAPAHVMNHS